MLVIQWVIASCYFLKRKFLNFRNMCSKIKCSKIWNIHSMEVSKFTVIYTCDNVSCDQPCDECLVCCKVFPLTVIPGEGVVVLLCLLLLPYSWNRGGTSLLWYREGLIPLGEGPSLPGGPVIMLEEEGMGDLMGVVLMGVVTWKYIFKSATFSECMKSIFFWKCCFKVPINVC